MLSKRLVSFSLVFLSAILTMLFCIKSAFAQSDTIYEKRGDHWEGVRKQLVSGLSLVLLSVTVSDKNPLAVAKKRTSALPQTLPNKLCVRFYAPPAPPPRPNLIVRELVNHEYYWLDNVSPEERWKAGADNDFTWDTTLLRQLEKIKSKSDLGVVVRLSEQNSGEEEWITPAVFLDYEASKIANKAGCPGYYQFVFKAEQSSEIVGNLYYDGVSKPLQGKDKQSKDKPVFSWRKSHVVGDNPFVRLWDGRKAPSGEYTLKLEGFESRNGSPIEKTVHFFHRVRQ